MISDILQTSAVNSNVPFGAPDEEAALVSIRPRR